MQEESFSRSAVFMSSASNALSRSRSFVQSDAPSLSARELSADHLVLVGEMVPHVKRS